MLVSSEFLKACCMLKLLGDSKPCFSLTRFRHDWSLILTHSRTAGAIKVGLFWVRLWTICGLWIWAMGHMDHRFSLFWFESSAIIQVAAVVVLVFTFSFNGGTMSSYIQNLINLAPNRFYLLPSLVFLPFFALPITFHQVGHSLWDLQRIWKHHWIPCAWDQETDCLGKFSISTVQSHQVPRLTD